MPQAWEVMPPWQLERGELAQHPGQIEDEHWHVPASQYSPNAQGSPVPHAQPPSVAHAFEAAAMQLWHVWALTPHCAGCCDEMHVLPEQQPFGHEAAVQRH
jgi:hypothetical protein